jgi:bidirectional [NiFe] hydrogenase diaphorase subunit
MPEPVSKPLAKDAPPHPSGDERFKILDACMKRHRFQHEALIEVLHTAQDAFGYLSNDLLLYIAHGLKLPPSRVYGVATFYHLFRFEPKGNHGCVICLGTACYVKGSDAIHRAVLRFAARGIERGAVSIDTARCLGACGLAPVGIFDGEIVGNLSRDSALERMEGWLDDGS